MKPLILAINPGSTSTKISVFEGATETYTQTLRHDPAEIGKYERVADQFPFRKGLIMQALEEAGVAASSLAAVIGRGGLVKPIPSGIYEVNEALKNDLINASLEHASNLGGLLAADIAAETPSAKAYIADPVVVDELIDAARVTGHPDMERKSIFHALNQKAVARACAEQMGRTYEEMNLIVAHMGGGISVGAHRAGRVIDVNNALDGEGPFSPERAGSLPAGDLVALCFSGNYTQAEVKKMLVGKGGLVTLIGENNVSALIRRRNEENDTKAGALVEAMTYNVGKWIGMMAAALEGKVDAIVVTGGIAYNKCLTDRLEEMTGFIAPHVVIPGENEMEALAINALRVLEGKLTPSLYE